jgi:hypothetical protein
VTRFSGGERMQEAPLLNREARQASCEGGRDVGAKATGGTERQ